MKIDSNLLFPDNRPVNGVGNSGTSNSSKAGSASSSSDEVRLSVNQSAIQALQAQLQNQPDIRSQRVAALQQAIRDGSYQVSNEQIADAMFTELLQRK